MDWKILAVTVPLLFASYQSLSKLLPKTTSIFLVNAYASLIGVIFMFLLHFFLSPNKSLTISSKTVPIVIGIGILISLGNFGIIKTLSMGAPQSLFSVVFYITLLLYGVMFGLIFWKESMNLPQICGMLLAVTGIVIIYYFKK